MPLLRMRLVLTCATLVICISSVPATAQDHAVTVFADVGFASIGHADSEQGKALTFGGGVTFWLTPWLGADADLHGAHVTHVFGRENHDFSELTVTGSLLVRAFRQQRVHLVAGGGLAMQRAHSEFDLAPFGRIDRRETLRLLHGRIGTDWDASQRIAIRTEAVFWIGGGLDWVMGGRVCIGYRF